MIWGWKIFGVPGVSGDGGKRRGGHVVRFPFFPFGCVVGNGN